MTIVVEGTTTGGVTTGDSSTLTSWTPAANELILLFVAMRNETITPTASGNGITFTQIHDIDNVQGQGGLTVFRGMSASPSSGSITVTHTGNALPVSCVAARFSGVDTSGTNGSGAIGNTASDTGPDPDDDDVIISVTVDASDNFAVGSAWHRAQTLSDPPATGETTIVVNSLFGTGGSQTHCSVWYQTGATGSVQLGQAANLSADGDHVESAIEVKAGGGPISQAVAGTLTSAGAVSKETDTSFAGTLTSAGTIAKATTLSALVGTLTSSGALSTSLVYLQSLVGTLTSSGAVSTVVSFIQSLAGTLTSSGGVATVYSQPSTGIIALTLQARSPALTLQARSPALTLPTRSHDLTLNPIP